MDVSLILWIAITSLLIALPAFCYIRVSKAHRVALTLESRKHAYRLQLDVHGLFNQFNSIGAQFYSLEPEISYDNLTRFSRTLRTRLLFDPPLLWSLSEELDFIDEFLQWKRENEHTDFVWDYQGRNMDVDNLQVPALFIFAQVYNVLTQSLRSHPGQGRLSVTFTKEGKYLRISIVDNGIGKRKAAASGYIPSGRVLSLTEAYMRLYGHRFRGNLQIVEEEAFPEEPYPGTHVRISFSCPLPDLAPRKKA